MKTQVFVFIPALGKRKYSKNQITYLPERTGSAR
jgi:hypothetical protein